MRLVMVVGAFAVLWGLYRYFLFGSLDAVHRRLRVSTHREEFALPQEATFLAKALDIPAQGTIQDFSHPYAMIQTRVRAGFAGLNAAHVQIQIWSAPNGSRIVVEAQAREGLIDQRTALGAAQQVANQLRSVISRKSAS